MIIKRLQDALNENDPILGVILSAHTNHSAESESITRPHVGAQRDIFRRILQKSRILPKQIDYVEMHGTGTQAGDVSEMTSVLSTFAPASDEARGFNQRTNANPLYVGSAKSNIGHGEAVSGVSALIKVLLMLQNKTIPPHCGIKTRINRRFPLDLAERHVHIATTPQHWSALHGEPRRAVINNFSAAGGNSALLLEEAPKIDKANENGTDPRSHHLIAVSAKNSTSMAKNLASMLDCVLRSPEVSLSHLSYTTTARRIHHPHRTMFAVANTTDLCALVKGAISEQAGATRPKDSPKLLFAFTGNGAQYAGMGRELFASHPFFRDEAIRLDKIAQSLGFESSLSILSSGDGGVDDFSTTAVHLATLILQIALRKLWSQWGVEPSAVVGHSLGEFAALNAAGVLSDADALYLVGSRADLLEEKCTRHTHSMLVVQADLAKLSQSLEGSEVEIACINSALETVVAGPALKVAKLQALLSSQKIRSTILKVPFAFHSSQMDPILDDLAQISRRVRLSEMQIQILCPLTGGVMKPSDILDPRYFVRHCRQTVRMLAALRSAQVQGVLPAKVLALEIGPHPAISGMIRLTWSNATTLASLQRGRPGWETITSTIKTLYSQGVAINWINYHSEFPSAQKVIPLPAYGWDLKPFWIQYKHAWSLRKGDPPFVEASRIISLESTTIHRVVEEMTTQTGHRLVAEADISREDLRPLVQGHEVDGVPLCTPSVYCDIALSLGKYLNTKYQAQSIMAMNVSDLEVSKALILNPTNRTQLLQAHGEVDWSRKELKIRFLSFDSKQKLQEHSRCTVRFSEKSSIERKQATKDMIKARIRQLHLDTASGASARFNKPMVYRMIRPLARFHQDYRAIKEVILNSNTLEATSKLHFGDIKWDGVFHTHPAVIDALTQSCGFAMNCNDFTDLDQDVYMNHGWGAFEIYCKLQADKEYTTYTCMKEGQSSIWYGDVTILDGEEIVATFERIAVCLHGHERQRKRTKHS